jgi:hypothetical protein
VSIRRAVQTIFRMMARTEPRSEAGQVLPIIAALSLVTLAVGVGLYWIGAATVQATNAQTAADAAALAGEKELLQELGRPHPVGEATAAGAFDLSEVCAAANAMARANQATVISCQSATGSGDAPYDLEVEVRADAHTPASQLEGGGQHAVAFARASTDDGAQASETISQGSDCVAGVLVGSPFTAHGGRYGFFPSPKADFTPDCEARLAGELDRLGIADQLRLTGVTGTLSNPPSTLTPVQTLEACSAAATVEGLSHLSAAQLDAYGIVRPVAGQQDVVSMNGSDSCTQVSSDSSTTPDAGGNDNANVHLVPWTGGPAAAAGISVSGGVPVAPSASQIQVACTIYSVWKSLNLNPEELEIALDVAQTESTMGLGLYGDGSYGVFQQEPQYWFMTDVSTPPIDQELDPQLAAEMFFEGADDGRTPGLAQIYPSASNQPIYEIAEDVQGSGAGLASDGKLNYGSPLNMASAMEFDTDVTGGQCKSVTTV